MFAEGIFAGEPCRSGWDTERRCLSTGAIGEMNVLARLAASHFRFEILSSCNRCSILFVGCGGSVPCSVIPSLHAAPYSLCSKSYRGPTPISNTSLPQRPQPGRKQISEHLSILVKYLVIAKLVWHSIYNICAGLRCRWRGGIVYLVLQKSFDCRLHCPVRIPTTYQNKFHPLSLQTSGLCLIPLASAMVKRPRRLSMPTC